VTPLIPALAGALFVAGLLGLVVGPPPTRPGTPTQHGRGRLSNRLARMSRKTRIRALAALVVGTSRCSPAG